MTLKDSVRHYTRRNIWNAVLRPVDDMVHKCFSFNVTQLVHIAISRVMESYVYEPDFVVADYMHACIKKL
jgi:hypothetical protein